jgi:hypothetical protein
MEWSRRGRRQNSTAVLGTGLFLSTSPQLFLVMLAVASAKEPLIGGRAAIRVLKHHKVAEPIFDAASFRTKELFATAIRATGGLSVRSGFVHGKILCWGRYLTTLGDLMDSAYMQT